MTAETKAEKPAGSLKAMAEGKVDVSLSGKTLKALLAAHGQCVVADEDDEL